MDRNLINQKIITKLDKVEKDFEEYYKQPETTRGNINSTINNYLARFTSDDIDEVFGAPSSFNTCNFEDIDKGKVFCISMPQKYQLERKYINTIFKLIYYTHALRRFDYPDKLKSSNLLILWADEAQGIVTAAEFGMTDYNTIDKTRAARATVVFATQTTTSYIPPLGLDKTKVLLANLANRITFTAADQDGAKMESDMIGKHEVIETSHSYSGGRTTTSKQKKEKAFVTDFELMGLKKFHCIIKHCEKKYKKILLKPIEYNGKIAEWFSKSKC